LTRGASARTKAALMTVARAKISGNMRGALWMLASAACFTIMTACIKHLAQQGFAESQMVFFRCAAGVVLLLPAVLRSGPSAWATPRPWVMARRCIGSAIGVLLAFYAFANLPLATAQSLSFARALFVVLLAMLLLREKVGPWRQGALVVGFIGVLVMTRPTEMQFNLAAFAALASAMLMAYSVVTIKDLSRDHSTLSLVLWMNAATTVLGLPLALFGWTMPGWGDAGIFLLLAVSGVLAQTCFTRGLTAGDASLMALMDYTRLPMAALSGLLIFHELLDIWTIIGAAIVIGSTLFITIREAMLAKKRAPPLPD
jgi:drug/metabolite transporter (DMT)-like permease